MEDSTVLGRDRSGTGPAPGSPERCDSPYGFDWESIELEFLESKACTGNAEVKVRMDSKTKSKPLEVLTRNFVQRQCQ